MKKLLAFLFFLFLLLIAYWADTGTMPTFLKAIYDFPNADKLGHFVLYGFLAYLLTVAMPFQHVKILRWIIPLGVVLAASFATLEEISQLFFVNRTASLVDPVTGYAGIFSATLFVPCLRGACISDFGSSDVES